MLRTFYTPVSAAALISAAVLAAVASMYRACMSGHMIPVMPVM